MIPCSYVLGFMTGQPQTFLGSVWFSSWLSLSNSQIIWEIVEFQETNGFCSERKEKWAVSNCTNKFEVIFPKKPPDDAIIYCFLKSSNSTSYLFSFTCDEIYLLKLYICTRIIGTLIIDKLASIVKMSIKYFINLYQYNARQKSTLSLLYHQVISNEILMKY